MYVEGPEEQLDEPTEDTRAPGRKDPPADAGRPGEGTGDTGRAEEESTDHAESS